VHKISSLHAVIVFGSFAPVTEVGAWLYEITKLCAEKQVNCRTGHQFTL